MNYQNPWMAKKGREETRLGWQNGSLDYDSFYAYLVVSTLLDFVRPLLDLAPSARFLHVRSRSRGAMERERTGCAWAELRCAHGRVDGASVGGAEGAHHREGERRTGTCGRAGGVAAAGLRERGLGDWLLESVVVGYRECLYGLMGFLP